MIQLEFCISLFNGFINGRTFISFEVLTCMLVHQLARWAASRVCSRGYTFVPEQLEDLSWLYAGVVLP